MIVPLLRLFDLATVQQSSNIVALIAGAGVMQAKAKAMIIT